MSFPLAADRNRAVLLAAVHPQPHELATLVSRHAEGLDWDWLLERAAAHKIDALLAHGIETVGAEGLVPAVARERLHAARSKALARYEKSLQDLEQIDRCLRRAGIAYVVVKGPVLAQQVYDSPAQRHFFDLDIVVRKTEVDATQAALESLGYHLWGGDRYLGFAPAREDDLAIATRAMHRSLKRFAHELAMVTPEHSLLPIDIHWHLMPRGRIRKEAAAGLWKNTTAATIGGIEVQVLGTEETLLHLSMHCWSNRPWSFNLLHLCDVAWALRRLPIDPERLADLSLCWGARADLGRALYAIEHVLGVMPPPAITGGASPPPNRFTKIATAENFVERHARPAPAGWARIQAEIGWGLAMGTLPSTAILLLGKYGALLQYYIERRGNTAT